MKEDDLLAKQDIANRPREVAAALLTELKIWLDNKCIAKELLSNASNLMASRYVYKWKIKKVEGKDQKTVRLRLVLRGFMDQEAFSVETFSGTARGQPRRFFASEAACHP